MSRRGLILLAHGSRDPRWREPFDRLVSKIASKLPDVAVRAAFLKELEPDIHAAARQLALSSVTDIAVVPVFLAAGGHSANDFPVIASRLVQAHPGVNFHWADVIGSWDEVIEALAAAVTGRIAEGLTDRDA